MDLPFAAADDATAAGSVSSSSAATTASSSTGSSARTGAELLHGHAPIVYDNLKSGHFGSTSAGSGDGVGYSNLSTNNPHHVRPQQHQQHYRNHHGNSSTATSTSTAAPHGHPPNDGGSEDDAFVTVSESDTDDFSFAAAVDDGDDGRGGTLDDDDVYYHYGDGGEHVPHDADIFGQNVLSDETNGRIQSERGGGQDVLSLLLSGPPNSDQEEEEKEGGGEGKPRNDAGQQASDLARTCEEAGRAARKAATLASPTKYGNNVDLEAAAAQHASAAAKYREAAVLVGSDDATLSRSLLLLSVAQARSASNVLAKHRNTHPTKSAATDTDNASQTKSLGSCTSSGMVSSTSFGMAALSNTVGAADSGSDGRPRSGSQSELQQERLRAKIRGAMDSGSKKEADMTDSMFLVGTSAKSASGDENNEKKVSSQNAEGIRPSDETSKQSAIEANGSDLSSTNPVDDMMKLQSELRAMDFALEMGSSVSSLGTRMTSARSVKTMDAEGSFCVVPGSASYMSSSIMRAPRPLPSRPTASNGVGRGKANRVQGTSAATSPASIAPTYQNVCLEDHGRAAQSSGLESSWWGQPSASHMSASISSVSGRAGQQDNVSNTKELMRLLDTIKTLGDENVALMREVEEAQAARQEAKVAKEQMKRFKEEYSKRFRNLQAALEKFRKAYAENPGQTKKNHHLLSSDLASSLESQKKDQMIRQLAAELKKEKEESKKKDAALRKYESFYREVKARSAQKAKQREQDQKRVAQQKKAKAGIDRTAR